MTVVEARCSQMLNTAENAGDADINQKQAKDWLLILKTLGIIFYLYPYSNNLLKRLVKTPKLYYYRDKDAKEIDIVLEILQPC